MRKTVHLNVLMSVKVDVYCMSSIDPILHCNFLYKMGQNFLDIQYVYNKGSALPRYWHVESGWNQNKVSQFWLWVCNSLIWLKRSIRRFDMGGGAWHRVQLGNTVYIRSVSFFDPCGRYGRFYGVTAWSISKDHFGPCRYTLKTTVTVTGKEKKISLW